jgi:DNA-binding NarL/FixJ family response regulator
MNIEQALPRVPARHGSRSGTMRGEPAPARLRPRTHVLIVDEEGLMRDALCMLLAKMPNVALVSGSPADAEALRGVSGLRPDVVILDFSSTPHARARMISTLKTEHPGIRVIVLAFLADEQLVESALRAGADGYLLKSDSSAELRQALHSAGAGIRYLSPSVTAAAMHRRRAAADDSRGREASLTARERQVIRLIASGHRTREIAQLLSLSHKTIEKHRTSLMRKLGLRNATAVAAFAIAHGFAKG